MERGRGFEEASLERADKALLAARTLLEKGLLADAVSRAYYAMFYADQAILRSKKLTAKSHAGTISLFGKEIAEKGIVPKDLGRNLHRAFDLRQKGDYEAEAEIEWEEAEGLVEQARTFLAVIRQALPPAKNGKKGGAL
ncbi:MAG: HEPN domain-containing protein [Chloroflexi bacterium]|nr:HEPN domain-containing protein [Chloroflexota bacterium]